MNSNLKCEIDKLNPELNIRIPKLVGWVAGDW